MEKWEVRKDFVFPHVCLVEGVEKWEDGKHFCLIGKKWEDGKYSLYKLTIMSLLYKSRKVRGVDENPYFETGGPMK